jgi:hypothetical protein
MGILIVIGMLTVFAMGLYKYVQYMRDKKVNKPHCGACK